MVRVAAGPLRDRPRLVPVQRVVVHEKAHQLGDRDRRMRVVELNGPVLRELVEPLAPHQVQPDHVLQRAGDEEILLRQTQALSRIGLVVRIQNLGDGFRNRLFVDGAVVVASVERVEVERFDRLGLPQAQQVRRRHAKPGHGRVVGDPLDHPLRNPADTVGAVLGVRLGASAELHVEGDLRSADLPRVAETQPFVRPFDLPAVVDRLVEDAEFVADAVTDRRDVQCRQRVHVAGRETSKTAVAKPRLLFLFEESGEVLADQRHSFLSRRPQAKVDETVSEMRAGQELGGEVRDEFRVRA